MFRWFRRGDAQLSDLTETLGGLGEALHALATTRTEDPSLELRVAALEREMERRHAEAEGLLLKARGKFEAARAAEERTRRLAERDEPSEEEQLEVLREAYAEAGVSLDDDLIGAEEGLHPVRNGVAARGQGKQAALALKFSGRR